MMTLQEINDLRSQLLAGEPITDEQLQASVAALRQDRMTAKPQQRGKAKKAAVSLMDLEIPGEGNAL